LEFGWALLNEEPAFDRTRADFAKTGAIAGSLRNKFNNWPMNKYRLSIAFNVTS
jgi:hypothetical protein